MTRAPAVWIVVALLGASLAACRSPFADWEESGPPEDPQKVGVGVHGWPVYERDPGAKGVRTDVLWPVASVRTAEDGTLRRAAFLVPIVLWEEDGTRSRFGVRPLFDVESDSREGAQVSDVDLLFPIVKWREAPGEGRFDIRPFWFRHWKEGAKDDTYLVPFYGSWWSPHTSGEFVFPLYGVNRAKDATTRWYAAGLVITQDDPTKSLEGTKLLLGALESTRWDDGSSWRVFPFVWHSEDVSESEDETFLFWPGLAGWTRDSDERTQWIVPVWYHTEDGDSQTSVVFPLWYSHDDDTGSARVLFPFYGFQRDEDLERTFWGGNLLITTERKDGGAVDVVWPIFHQETDAKGWDARLFPVVWLDRHEDRGHTHLWPVVGHSWKGDESEWSVAWPLFTVTSAENGWEASLPAPLVELDRRGDQRETRVFPLVRHEWSEKDGSYEGDVLWLLSNWEGDGKGTSDFRILWRLVQDTDTGDRRVFAVNPLFRHETNTRGDDHWSALLGLVARTREADDVRWRLLWFINL